MFLHNTRFARLRLGTAGTGVSRRGREGEKMTPSTAMMHAIDEGFSWTRDKAILNRGYSLGEGRAKLEARRKDPPRHRIVETKRSFSPLFLM